MSVPVAPYIRTHRSVRSIMGFVLLALLPSIGLSCVLFGPSILLNILICSLGCLIFEGLSVATRKKKVLPFLLDGSALITGWLIALSFPTTVPWWLFILACFISIVITKHLYGGLGNNIFNPAMMAYAVCLLCYPAFMSRWPSLPVPLSWHGIELLFTKKIVGMDAMTESTTLDIIRTGITSKLLTVPHIKKTMPTHFGYAGSPGYEWIALSYCLGGVFLLWRGIIHWTLPLPFLLTLAGLSLMGHVFYPNHFVGPMEEIMMGGTLLAAWFVVTDPVSAASTPRGQIIFSMGIGLLTFFIRHFGGYPDGIAFAVILMNLCVPLIDRYTQPPVFGRHS